jgi:hypothetical protein
MMSVHAVDLFDWAPRFPICVVFGHEVEGIRPEVSELSDTHIRIPMLGTRHSLNSHGRRRSDIRTTPQIPGLGRPRNFGLG